jgi:large subunit ribosomal protein L35
MPKLKLKTHSASKKRFSLTGTGKVKRSKAYKRHLLTSKTTKRKRGLRKATIASPANARIIKSMIPYK